MVGSSGSGKSTLFNVFHGTQYTLVEDENTGDSSLKPDDATPRELAQCGHEGRSETSHAQISKLDDSTYVADLPGSNDTRAIGGSKLGEALQISIGLSLQSLAQCFTHVRTIGMVLLYPDIYNRAEKFQEALRTIGKIIHQNPELLENICFVVNQTPDGKNAKQILTKIKAIAAANKDTFNDDMQFVIERLEEKHFKLIHGVPGEVFRTEFLANSQAMQAKPFSDFDFSSYNKEAQRFKELFSYALDSYEKKVAKKLHEMQTELASLKSQAQQAIAKIKQDVTRALSLPKKCRESSCTIK